MFAKSKYLRGLAVGLFAAGASLVGMKEASAHATSIGYANAGPGIVAVWLGTYNHGTSSHHLEGSMNLTGVDVIYNQTNPFTLAAGVGGALWQGYAGYQGAAKPAGLVDGTTNFYGCNSTGALTNSCTGSASSFGQPDHWQGALFAGLTPGTYQFNWTPIANPTAEWSLLNPNMNGQFTISGTVINPTNVPIPAALPLLGGALGALGFFGWRRRKAS
ncbi:hypothetical protein [Roseibium sp.]|uniref:hypothetical protein n=1 Tax=Roseibium sp. TaxID=1936156 RepID=UPI003BA9161B